MDHPPPWGTRPQTPGLIFKQAMGDAELVMHPPARGIHPVFATTVARSAQPRCVGG